MGNIDLSELSYLYVETMSKTKQYNPQAIANNKIIGELGKENIIRILNLDIDVFCTKYKSSKCRDFIYKNDYLTPRNMYLVNPLYYLKYTQIVFEIAENYLEYKSKELNFKDDNIKVFYSGLFCLDKKKETVNINAVFNNSYSDFQKERKKYFGNYVLKLDLQNFFDSIEIKELLSKLRIKLGSLSVIDELEIMLNSCQFTTLPQLHYSIASSLLSQMYLADFDNGIQNILARENLELIRFVDDIYIIQPHGEVNEKAINNLINDVSFLLWQEKLSLNNTKTELLTPDEYENNFDLKENKYDYSPTSFSTEKIIDEKVLSLIHSGDLITYIEKLCEIEKTYGIDLKKYHELTDKYISTVNGDSNKVINGLIFSGKWRLLSDNELFEIVSEWKYVFFNPSQFTILYILICRYLENKNVIGNSRIMSLLSYLFTSESYNFRDTLIAISYLFQSKKKNVSILSQIKTINPEYVNFVEKYI
ncbi:hypothetical protein DVB69_07020 [Sporosarcina sp. BI001-red]|uniref:reverse transcriptase domain-containing protein n=1 Tax=Sporosarcina sp. BI001-red TaxID=2282866 RepID=UPI000E23ABE2|nr:reverse transcriptase domain-containing protein [Sporosarcina sp. BI001-red]REB08864.1 hypothetical protein DVB69_07020 [Sporosarcina sp. BI001-red]